MKKLFSIIMSVLMIMCFMPGMAFAEESYVAKIDGKGYTSLSEAVTKAQDGDTINILTDCEIEPVEIGSGGTLTKGITIEGNGHTVTGWDKTEYKGNFPIALDVYGKVTFNNMKFTDFACGDEGTDLYSAIINGLGGCDITITNCSFENFNRQVVMFAPAGDGSMTVENSTFDCTPVKEEFVIQKAFVIEPGTCDSEVTIRNSTIICAKSTAEGWTSGGVEIFGGTVLIEGCTITSCDEGVIVSREYFNNQGYVDYDVSSNVTLRKNEINANNSAVRIDCYKGGATTANVVIQSGIHEGKIGVKQSATEENESDIASDDDLKRCSLNITGGTFDNDPSAYISENSIVMRSGDEGSYLYEVVAKSGLRTGTYLSDPGEYLASGRYWAIKNSDGTYTVYYSAPSSSGSSSSSAVVNSTETKTNISETGSETTTIQKITANIKAETKEATDGTKTVAATVDTKIANQIVEKAVEYKSEKVVVNTMAAAAVSETAAGTKTEIDLPEHTVQALAEKTEASVTIKSDAAEVTLDKAAVDGLASQAGDDGYVKLVVETVAQDEKKVEVDLKLETSKGIVSDFKGGSVAVTVKLNSDLATKEVVCVYIDDNGIYHKVAGQKNEDGTYTFTTGHFSTYAIMAEEDADAVIAAQAASAKELASALSFKARTTKTSKGMIKVDLTVSDKKIQAIEKLGYTVKYKFYRSTKKSSGYKAMKEKDVKTYINTSGKKGTRYYYKARVMVYDSEGTLIAKTALKQCRYAYRTK